MYPSDDPTSTTASSACSVSRPSSASSVQPRDSSHVLPPGAPTTSLFEIRDTPTAGRAVFATQDISQGTLLWNSDDLTLSVLLREYRREVCGQCFSYDYGRHLAIRDQSVGFAFCSIECQQMWEQRNGDVGVQAWTAVEKLTKKRGKEDDDMVEMDLPRPSPKEIRNAWELVASQADLINVARAAEQSKTADGRTLAQMTRQHRKALSKALEEKISPDVMSFLVSGIVWRYNKPHDWKNVLALADDKTPYHSADDLQAFVRSYLQLLATLPTQLLPLCTPKTMFLLSSRDSHNSFGIRSLGDDGSEFFGYGCWPAASYFNHSCGPNIEKNREGRVWKFRAGRDIAAGEELNITYLSGEERKLSRGKRRETLKRNWGFECGCERCEGE